MKVCHLVGAGDFAPEYFHPQPGDLVIACDAGLVNVESVGLRPDLIVGDFDSYPGGVPLGENVTVLPREKDDTDMLYAARMGLSRGFRRFYLHGSLGGARPSHSLANVSLLLFLHSRGADGLLLSRRVMVRLLKDETLSLLPASGGYVSLFALISPCLVHLAGLKYPYDGMLSPQHPLGVSNEFIGTAASIGVSVGELLAIFEDTGLSPADLFPE